MSRLNATLFCYVPEPAAGFEPATNGLQNRCSTTELCRQACFLSGCPTRKLSTANMALYFVISVESFSQFQRFTITTRQIFFIEISSFRSWSRWESNPRPSACKADALPAELLPQGHRYQRKVTRPFTISPTSELQGLQALDRLAQPRPIRKVDSPSLVTSHG